VEDVSPFSLTQIERTAPVEAAGSKKAKAGMAFAFSRKVTIP
jgi:hypothetical protein